MATSKKTTPTPKKAAKPPVVVVKKEKFNAENEIKVLLERLKAIDDYITRSDNADTKDKQKFEKFISNVSVNFDALKRECLTTKERVESLEKGQEANENRVINLTTDWGKEKNQTMTSFKALREEQMGNEMAIEAVDEAMRKTFSIYSGIAIIGFIAGIGAIAMEIYKFYH
jgi:predicted  nucleic acid-binding Zn-ribbon protein